MELNGMEWLNGSNGMEFKYKNEKKNIKKIKKIKKIYIKIKNIDENQTEFTTK